MKYMTRFHDAQELRVLLFPSVALAKRMEKSGADAVIAEGMEAGGHIEVECDDDLGSPGAAAVSIPVIAAGGIADGEGVLQGFMAVLRPFKLVRVSLVTAKNQRPSNTRKKS